MKVTEREKAVIYALAAGGIDDWKKAYILSRNYSIEEAEQIKSLGPTVTRWRQRPDIISIYQNAVAVLKAKEDRIKEEARQTMKEEGRTEEEETGAADNNRSQGRRAAAVDYYDPQNQRKTINAIIDRAADDPKTQLDAIKTIQQTQRDDRQAAKDNQVQRFYMPVTCKICPLYQRKAKKDAGKS